MAGKGDSLANSSESELSSGLDNLLAKNPGKHNSKNGMDEWMKTLSLSWPKEIDPSIV